MIEDLYGVTKQADVVRGKGQYRRLLVQKYRKNEGERPVFDFAGHAADSADLRKLWRSVRAGDEKKQSDGVLVKGTVNVQILYESAEEEVPCGCLKGELVFEELLETAEPVKNTCSCRIAASLEQLSVQAQNEQEAEVRAVVCVKGLICADCEEEIVTDALLRAPDPEKQANQPGIVVYLAGEGETLWDICKKITTFRWMECAK